MMPFLDTHFGNPSSSHHYGAAPHAAVARAREQIAALIGAVPDEITFTGSGSEADAMASAASCSRQSTRGLTGPR